MTKNKGIFKLGQKIILDGVKYKIVDFGWTVSAGHDSIGKPGTYSTVTLQDPDGKHIKFLSVILKKKLDEQKNKIVKG